MLDYDDPLATAAIYDEIARRVGHTLWQISAFEDTLAYVLVLRVESRREMGLEEAQALLSRVRARTLGKLLRPIREAGIVDAATIRELEWLLEGRNWLVHRSMREHHGVLNNEPKRAALLVRLNALSARSRAMHHSLSRQLHAWILTQGDFAEAIETQLAKNIADLRSGNPDF